MKDFFKRLYIIPFQAGFSVYIALNGIISSHSDSAVFANLMNLFGWYASLLLGLQIFSGINMLVGAGLDNKNIESFGLVLASILFLLRAFVLVTDGDITPADINATLISIIISFAAIARLWMIYYAKIKHLSIWIKK